MRDRFLSQKDQLAVLINGHALDLYNKLLSLSVEKLGLPDHCLYYFRNSHFNRLFFSIETSAHLLYRSITIQNKPASSIVIMDYGAGVGTLYMLAKMIGCRKVIYNDFLEEWQFSAMKIAEAIDIRIDEYIVGDIDETLGVLRRKNVLCDIITSRNVIEHVYKLDYFYQSLILHQPQAVIYSSTTANFYNPASNIKHVLWHRKWEKVYYLQRMDTIKAMGLGIPDNALASLAKKTRGLAGSDLINSIKDYAISKKLPNPEKLYTNTCEPATGVWAEHLLTFSQYRNNIRDENYSIIFLPGFWDTHYVKAWKNIFARFMNRIINITGNRGIIFAPFIYVIVQPQTSQ